MRVLAIAARTLMWVAFVAAAVWFLDYLSIRYRIPGNRQQFGSVTVRVLLAVPQKDQRIEYIPQDNEVDNCSYSIFPQLGYYPCWYLSRKPERRISM